MKIAKWILGILIILVATATAFLFKADLPATTVDAKYTNSESRFLTMENGSRVHYRDQGNAAGLPVVLVHGAMASLHTWEPWVNILGQQYRIITLDLPAHGLTGRVPNSKYGADAFIKTIDAVADSAGIESFVLGGSSMGGGTAWRFAHAYPERVIALLLVNSVPPGNWQRFYAKGDARKSRPAAFTLLQQDWFRTIARYLDPEPLIGRALRSVYNDSSVVNQKLIDRYYELIMREGTRAAILSRRRPYGEAEPQPIDLAQLTQPTLIMWGAQDTVIPVSVASLFEKYLPNTTTVIYQDLGHIPMEEDPVRSAADVIQFLQSLTPTHVESSNHEPKKTHHP